MHRVHCTPSSLPRSLLSKLHQTLKVSFSGMRRNGNALYENCTSTTPLHVHPCWCPYSHHFMSSPLFFLGTWSRRPYKISILHACMQGASLLRRFRCHSDYSALHARLSTRSASSRQHVWLVTHTMMRPPHMIGTIQVATMCLSAVPPSHTHAAPGSV